MSLTTEYSLRAVVCLAEAGQAQNLHQIAEKTQVPEAYLAKVLRALTESGLLLSQRGVKGGYELARPAAALSLLEVVNAVEPIQRVRSCPLGPEAHARGQCPLHARIDQAIEAFEAEFRHTTVAEVLTRPIITGVAGNEPSRREGWPRGVRYERPSL